MFSVFQEMLTKVLEEYGFSAFLVLLTLGLIVYFSKYVIKRMETLHNAEVERLVKDRNRLLEHILQDRRSSRDMDKVVEKLEGSDQTGGNHE